MNTSVSITLEKVDVLQTLDALNDRAEAWEKTEAALNGKVDSFDDFFLPEECHDPSEAGEIAQHFRDIVSKIEVQLAEYRQEGENNPRKV